MIVVVTAAMTALATIMAGMGTAATIAGGTAGAISKPEVAWCG